MTNRKDLVYYHFVKSVKSRTTFWYWLPHKECPVEDLEQRLIGLKSDQVVNDEAVRSILEHLDQTRKDLFDSELQLDNKLHYQAVLNEQIKFIENQLQSRKRT